MPDKVTALLDHIWKLQGYVRKNSPSDESKGEGYHRAINVTSQHVPKARTPWVLGSALHGQSLVRCSNVVDARSDVTHKLFRFERAKHNRILRTSARKNWNPGKMLDNLDPTFIWNG